MGDRRPQMVPDAVRIEHLSRQILEANKLIEDLFYSEGVSEDLKKRMQHYLEKHVGIEFET